MAINKVEICGLDTSKLPVMNHNKSRELLVRVQQGGSAAREAFIEDDLRLVLSVIQRFLNRGGEQMDDLFQVMGEQLSLMELSQSRLYIGGSIILVEYERGGTQVNLTKVRHCGAKMHLLFTFGSSKHVQAYLEKSHRICYD